MKSLKEKNGMLVRMDFKYLINSTMINNEMNRIMIKRIAKRINENEAFVINAYYTL